MTTIEQAAQALRELIRVAKDGRDAMYAEAQHYHEAMKGYRPERHANMDEEVAGADRAIAAAESALASLEAAKQEPLPKEPPLGLLMSMAIRFDHGLGVPDYYDWPLFQRPGQPSHAKRVEATLTMMRQIYEEVSGHGFYKPEKEAEYAALAAAPSPGSGT